MALLGNYSVILKNPATFIGGTQVSNCRSAFNCNSQNRQRYYPEVDGLPLTASLPTGTEPPYSWIIPYKGGELSSTTSINGASTMSASQQNGINIVSSIAGVGTIDTAGLSLVTSMVSAIAGSGALTGEMVGTVQLAASLAGAGDITGAVSMLSGLIANLSGSGAISANLKGKLFMEAQIYINEGQATIDQIVEGVVEAGGPGGSSITQQEVRDALALALTGGETVEDGSIEKMLKEVHELQGLEAGSTVEITDTTRQVIIDSVPVIEQTFSDDGTTTTVERA